MTTKISRSDILKKEFLEECFVADFETGTLTWKVRPRHHFSTERGWKVANTQRSGCVANLSWRKSDSYICERVTVGGVHIPVHHVIWVMFYGELPEKGRYEIDHIDRNPRNNSISNLRIATPSENNHNTIGKLSGKSSDWKGVCFDTDRNKWMLQIVLPIGKISGRFNDEQSAAYLYRVFSENYHGEFSPEFLKVVDFPLGFDFLGITPKLRSHLMTCRDEIKSKHSEFFSKLAEFKRRDVIKKTNTGVPYVSMTTDKAVIGEGRKFTARNEKLGAKSFSVRKYGYDEAFRLACEWASGELETF